MIQFCQTILYVEDVHASIEFYKKAFGLEERFIHESGSYAEIESQTIALAFAKKTFIKSHLEYPFHNSTRKDPPPPFEIAFITDNVEATYQNAVEQGALIVQEPMEKPWGQIVAYVRDLDGFLIEIGSHVTT